MLLALFSFVFCSFCFLLFGFFFVVVVVVVFFSWEADIFPSRVSFFCRVRREHCQCEFVPTLLFLIVVDI